MQRMLPFDSYAKPAAVDTQRSLRASLWAGTERPVCEMQRTFGTSK